MIKIIKGTYGYINKGRIEPKNSSSEPFSIDPQREAELVEQGVAIYVDVPQKEAVKEPENAVADNAEITLEALKDMNFDALKDFAKQYGLTYKVGTKKTAFAKMVFEAINTAEAVEEADEEPPVIDAADAVV